MFIAVLSITAPNFTQILYGNADQCFTTQGRNMGKSHKYNIERKKPVPKHYIFYDSIYLKYRNRKR